MAVNGGQPSIPKFSLFSGNALNAVHNELDGPNDRSPPKPLSARSKPHSVKVKPKRPSSANPRLRSHRDPGRGHGVKDKAPQNRAPSPKRAQEPHDVESRGAVLPKEELVQLVRQLKKQQRNDESTIAHLRAENQRMESEIAKQQHRIDKILSPQFAKNTHLVLELRREIEKSVLVRQLKAQMLALRSIIAERDVTIEQMQKSTGATHLLELTAEKEEYFNEVRRLHRVIAQKEKELDNERQSHAWEKSGTANVEGDLREEIDRLSRGYQMVLERLEERVGSRTGSPRGAGGNRRPDTSGGAPALHQSRPRAAGTSRPKSASNSRIGKKADGADGKSSGAAASESALCPPHGDPSTLDYIDPVLISFDDRKNKSIPEQGLLENTREPPSDPPFPSSMPNVQQTQEKNSTLNYSLLEMSEEAEIPGGGKMEVVADSAAGWLPQGILPLGCKVQVKCKDSETLFSGRICGHTGGEQGTYEICYDNGNKESGVSRALIIVYGEIRKKEDISLTAIFKVGDKLEGNYKGSGSWYPAKVKSINPADGSYTIEYDDGDNERNVPECNLRLISVPKPSEILKQQPVGTATTKFLVQQEVMARYGGNSKWYPGKIKRVTASGSYDLLYDDGEEERNVPEDLVRARDAVEAEENEDSNEGATPGSSKYTKGDKVEVRFRGRARWFVGEVVRVRENEHYDIDYEDGEQERRVPNDFIRPVSERDEKVHGDDYSVGDKVLANFGEEGEYFSGVVRRKVKEAYGGGIQMVYDIDYDDGDHETGVTVSLMKPYISEPPEPELAMDSPLQATAATAGDLAPAGSAKKIVMEDDLNDFLAGLSDDEEDDEGVIGGGLDAGGSQYEGQDVERDEYGEDFED